MVKWDISKIMEGADSITGDSQSVNVYSEAGEFVANLPAMPFVKAPTVIVWGNRFFLFWEITLLKKVIRLASIERLRR